MKKRWAGSVLLILMSRQAIGQDVPKYELFGGYSYYRLQKSTFFDRLGNNSSGWNGSATLNVTPWVGLLAEIGAHYSPQETTSDRQRTVTSSLDTYRVLFGPRFTLRTNKLVPFVQALVGVAHSKRDDFGTAEGQPFSGSISKTGLALAGGAGLDVKAGDRFGVRIIHADYVLDRFTDSRFTPATITSRGWRLSFGVVFQFGKI